MEVGWVLTSNVEDVKQSRHLSKEGGYNSSVYRVATVGKGNNLTKGEPEKLNFWRSMQKYVEV